MSFSLTRLNSWSSGYFIVSVVQMILTALIIVTLPLWKRDEEETKATLSRRVTLKEIFSLPGVVPCIFIFFLYCAFELTASLWAASYLVIDRGTSAATASSIAGLYYVGITVGRAINGFLAMKLSDNVQIRAGYTVMLTGLALVFIGQGVISLSVGLVIMGIGSAPIFPSALHMTPKTFGEERSQAMIGIQMAFAYTGCLVPPVFGFVAEWISITLLPAFLLILLCLMILCYEMVRHRAKAE
jgi:fucose permease